MHRAVVLFFAASACIPAQDLRLNEIQVIGSHNSYHSGLPPSQMALLRSTNPKAAAGLDYRHPPLDVQLNEGIRQVELDIFADTAGGRYADPAGPRWVAAAKLPADPPNPHSTLMQKPGFKVMHVQDLDYRSNCEPFTNCLTVIRTWSKAHPGHLPIFILVETKEDNPRPEKMVEPEKFTTAVFDALDKEILSVFSRDEIITPDSVRGKHDTLEDAVLADGWPRLSDARGKVIFLLDQKKAGPAYLEGHPSLKGRVIFTNADPGSPDAAFVEVNDPVKDPALIPGLVRKGYLVRTRTDADLVQARANDVSQRDAALASGAQMLSSDFAFNERAETGYSVSFPGSTIARCNPVLKPAGCHAAALESSTSAGR